MNRPRDPLTPEWAAALIIQKGEADALAVKFGRTKSLIYSWADPNDRALPNMNQMRLADAHCLQAFGREPFNEVWQSNRNEAPAGVCLKDELVTMVQAFGDISGKVIEALDDDDVTPAERAILREASRNFRALFDRFDSTVDEVSGTSNVRSMA
ncbi:MAG: hypothetical protein AAF562_10085 [Pseudomonadota bacterium]